MHALIKRAVILGMLALSLAGCSQVQQQTVKPRLFWPPPPNDPKLEWVGSYNGNQDLNTKPPSLFATIIGADQSYSLDRPLAVASDGNGLVFVTDAEQNAVIVFDFNKEDTYRLGGDELAGLIRHLTGITVDADDNAYVADSTLRRVFVFNTKTNKLVKTLDLSPHVGSIGMLAIDKARKRLIVPDVKQNKIVVFDLNGKQLLSFGKKGDGNGEFNLPLSVAVESNGNIVVCDSFNARIQRFTLEGVFINKFGNRGDGLGDFSIIKGVAVDSEGHIYVTDGKENRFSVFSEKGDVLTVIGRTYGLREGGKAVAGGFLVPQGIYIDHNDRIYIADQLNRRIQIYQYLNESYLKRNPIPPKPAGVK